MAPYKDHLEFDDQPAISTFGSGTPVDAGVNGLDDVFVAGVLEVDDELVLNGALYMKDSNGPEGDSVIYFYDNGVRAGETFKWRNVDQRFKLLAGRNVWQIRIVSRVVTKRVLLR